MQRICGGYKHDILGQLFGNHPYLGGNRGHHGKLPCNGDQPGGDDDLQHRGNNCYLHGKRCSGQLLIRQLHGNGER